MEPIEQPEKKRKIDTAESSKFHDTCIICDDKRFYTTRDILKMATSYWDTAFHENATVTEIIVTDDPVDFKSLLNIITMTPEKYFHSSHVKNVWNVLKLSHKYRTKDIYDALKKYIRTTEEILHITVENIAIAHELNDREFFDTLCSAMIKSSHGTLNVEKLQYKVLEYLYDELLVTSNKETEILNTITGLVSVLPVCENKSCPCIQTLQEISKCLESND
ncbi:MAG: hypothetical protein Dasosvirus20_2 [Dasosvirus sp.]|uniref:BTB domain-containing protein n=1 Tax=Dasosvirus sp. TaxID=2487764 RepID=A0A3G4ZRV4_9VIRU|nr:MAG: hypothetical protein Dasosvirus20_2 [Dasosvirus sp.]